MTAVHTLEGTFGLHGSGARPVVMGAYETGGGAACVPPRVVGRVVGRAVVCATLPLFGTQDGLSEIN